MRKLSVLITVAMLIFSTKVYAIPQTIEADGEYIMSNSDTLDIAKEKAMQEALRNAVEKAGIYVESYSKVKNMDLTEDQVRILAGNIIKVNSKKIITEASNNIFSIKCYIHAIIDTDTIDLQRVMEMKKTQEENVRLMKTVNDLQKESKILKEQYQRIQSEDEKLKIKNELLENERDLGNLYKKDYQGKNILHEINTTTAEFSNLGKMYPGMPDNEFVSQIESQLISGGYQYERLKNGIKNFYKVIDENFSEEIIYDPTSNNITVFFYTPSELAADKIFKIAFANMYSLYGEPQLLNLEETESATWMKELPSGEKYSTQIYKTYDGKNYWMRITKDFYNRNAIKHTKFSYERVFENLKPVSGNWYDEHGNKVLSIADGNINGSKVIAGFDFAGGRGQYGVYRIMENSGPKDITIEKLSEKLIKVDNNTILKNTEIASYYESVNGIYLGMSKSSLSNKVGKPDSIINNAIRPTWVYNDLGISIQFESDRIVSISMKNNGKWFLDRSKLNYRNPISDYVSAYQLNKIPKPLTREQRKQGYIGSAYKIADDEYLWFDYYPDSITLSIFGN